MDSSAGGASVRWLELSTCLRACDRKTNSWQAAAEPSPLQPSAAARNSRSPQRSHDCSQRWGIPDAMAALAGAMGVVGRHAAVDARVRIGPHVDCPPSHCDPMRDDRGLAGRPTGISRSQPSSPFSFGCGPPLTCLAALLHPLCDTRTRNTRIYSVACADHNRRGTSRTALHCTCMHTHRGSHGDGWRTLTLAWTDASDGAARDGRHGIAVTAATAPLQTQKAVRLSRDWGMRRAEEWAEMRWALPGRTAARRRVGRRTAAAADR